MILSYEEYHCPYCDHIEEIQPLDFDEEGIVICKKCGHEFFMHKEYLLRFRTYKIEDDY